MPLCAECDENLPRDCFSGSQLKLKSDGRRCKNCVSENPDNDRRLGVLPPTAINNEALPEDVDKDLKDMTSEERVEIFKAGLAAFGMGEELFQMPEMRDSMNKIMEAVASGAVQDSVYDFGRHAVKDQRAREQLRAERAAAPARAPATARAPPARAPAPALPPPPTIAALKADGTRLLKSDDALLQDKRAKTFALASTISMCVPVASAKKDKDGAAFEACTEFAQCKLVYTQGHLAAAHGRAGTIDEARAFAQRGRNGQQGAMGAADLIYQEVEKEARTAK